MEQEHQWKRTGPGHGKRFAIGTVLALSLTLVAFEWSTTYNPRVHIGELTLGEPIFDDVPRVKIKVEVEKLPEEVKPKPKNTSGPVNVVDEPVHIDLAPLVVEIPVPEATLAGTASPEAVEVASTGSKIEMKAPILNPEVLPHFTDCIRGEIDKTNKCTEARIQRHLERYLKIPASVKGTVSTTVTFEIDAQGNIGRLHCAPKVSPEVEKEIERTIRSLPEFMPGTQGGYPVAVYYQIPLRLRTN